jgi:hypothetical protein
MTRLGDLMGDGDWFASLAVVGGKREVVAKRQRILASYEVAGCTTKQFHAS